MGWSQQLSGNAARPGEGLLLRMPVRDHRPGPKSEMVTNRQLESLPDRRRYALKACCPHFCHMQEPMRTWFGHGSNVHTTGDNRPMRLHDYPRRVTDE